MAGAGVPEEALVLDPRQNSVLELLGWPEDAGIHSFLLLWIEALELKTEKESLSPSFISQSLARTSHL